MCIETYEQAQARRKEEYQDPRWVRLSHIVKVKRGWECAECGHKGGDVKLHHSVYSYDKSRPVWDYAEKWMVVLCKKCHDVHHKTNPITYIEDDLCNPKEDSMVSETRVDKSVKSPEVVDEEIDLAKSTNSNSSSVFLYALDTSLNKKQAIFATRVKRMMQKHLNCKVKVSELNRVIVCLAMEHEDSLPEIIRKCRSDYLTRR